MNKIVPEDANLIPSNARRVFKGEIFEVWQWPQKMYDGSTQTFEMLKRPDTVVVLAVKDEKLIILNQSQPNRQKSFMDFPGGRADEGETPIESAQRELLEETGMKFKSWKLINVVQPLYKMEWFVYTYLATEFESQGETNHDSGEKIEVLSMSYDDIQNIDTNNARFDQGLFATYKNLDELTNAPEYLGREYLTS